MHKNRTMKKVALGAATLIAGMSSQALLAQDTFTVSGNVSYGYYYSSDTGNTNYLTGGTFEATIHHDSTTPLTYSDYYNNNYYYYDYQSWYSYWENAVTEIQYVVFDSNGNEVVSFTHNPDDTEYSYGGAYKGLVDYAHTYDDYRYEQWYMDNYEYTSDHYVYDYSYAYTYDYGDITPEEIAAVEVYPDPFDNEAWDFSEFYSYRDSYDYSTSSYEYFYFSGAISEIGTGDVDTDGDGILDSVDACTESDLSATVVVGANDSGVTNHLLESGCTITDTIAQIQADADKHGKVVSGVSHFLNHLKDSGVLSGKEKGAIQSATAKTNGQSKGKNK